MVKVVEQDFAVNQRQFAEIQWQLRQLLGFEIMIEHVGSTAVPGLIGKNIIDILIGIPKHYHVCLMASQLSAAGWFIGQKCHADYCFLASRQTETIAGDAHLHLVPVNTTRYSQFLAIRRFLRREPLWRQRYNETKRQIILTVGNDRQSYKQLKSQFVVSMLNHITYK